MLVCPAWTVHKCSCLAGQRIFFHLWNQKTDYYVQRFPTLNWSRTRCENLRSLTTSVLYAYPVTLAKSTYYKTRVCVNSLLLLLRLPGPSPRVESRRLINANGFVIRGCNGLHNLDFLRERYVQRFNTLAAFSERYKMLALPKILIWKNGHLKLTTVLDWQLVVRHTVYCRRHCSVIVWRPLCDGAACVDFP